MKKNYMAINWQGFVYNLWQTYESGNYNSGCWRKEEKDISNREEDRIVSMHAYKPNQLLTSSTKENI